MRQTKNQGDLNIVRRQSRIPAVIYGHGTDNKNLLLDYREFDKLLATAGTSSLVDLEIEGESKPTKVLISEIQRDPTTERFLHVDLHQINMKEKVRTHVSLRFIGDAPAVKSLGANLIVNMDTLEIECLPADLLSSIDVDLSSLEQIDATIRVADLKLSPAITVLVDATESVVSVLAPRAEKVEEAAVAPVTDVAAAETAEGETSADTTATGKEGTLPAKDSKST